MSTETGTRVDTAPEPAPGQYDYPPLREGRGVAVLDEIAAPAHRIASVNQVMSAAAKRLNGLVKLPYLLLPLPWPRLTYAHVAGANGTSLPR
jgi:hypothetical protein